MPDRTYPGTLVGTQLLAADPDPARSMADGIHRFLDRVTMAAQTARPARWARDVSSHGAYAASVRPNRAHLATIIGAADPRVPVVMSTPVAPGRLSSERVSPGGTGGCTARAVAWTVLAGVTAEGLLLEPGGHVRANVIAVPDCDTPPEALAGLIPGMPESAQFARLLAEKGCRVLIPTLINRDCTHCGLPGFKMTNMPHREFIYRAAFELGHHIIGYEVQKVLAAVDWFTDAAGRDDAEHPPLGVIGYGEGGLLSLYAAALDERISAASVLGYFGPREGLWKEPIHRNVFALLETFGDAEIASLIAPRALIVEACAHPAVDGPPTPTESRSAAAASGRIDTPPTEAVAREIQQARKLTEGLLPAPTLELIIPEKDTPGPGSAPTLAAFLGALGLARNGTSACQPTPAGTAAPAIAARQERQFRELSEHTQTLLRDAEFRRTEFWAEADATSVEAWETSSDAYRDHLWQDIIGKFPAPSLPPTPASRLIYEEDTYAGYEVKLAVYPDVFAYGILLLPRNLTEGERRPLVVCQHGLEGTPRDVIEHKPGGSAYNEYAARLVERGFIVYAPQNPYTGQDHFRTLQRKLNPLGKSLFSVIIRQHEVTLDWLVTQPFVDPERIAFYGISYGGKTAMRVPSLVKRYCLSICSADFNEWIWKCASAHHRYSYLFTPEYDMCEFNLGNTLNYAEMSWLIFPRPFMVERGHHDGVAPDEWVAYEYAKTFRHYDLMGLGDKTEMEIFDGPHCIHGVGTFAFLHKHLDWPEADGGGHGRLKAEG